MPTLETGETAKCAGESRAEGSMKRKKLIIRIGLGVLVFILIALGLFQLSRSRTFQLFGGIVNREATDEKVAALTFDDGPSAQTDEILRILDAEQAKATFFLVGQEIAAHPQEAARIAAAGYQIGNHSYSHQRMVLHSYGFISDEIERTDKLIRQAGYDGEIRFRPPNGKKLVLLPLYLKLHDRKTILWTLEPNSYPEVDATAEGIVQYVLKHAQPGMIVLLHPMGERSGQTSREALPGIVQGLRAQGYALLTVNELLARSPAR